MNTEATDILVLGATGKVGRLLRAADWRRPAAVSWQGRSAQGPGWLPWQPGMALPRVQLVLLLSGVTAGDAAALAQNARIAEAVGLAARAGGVGGILLASTIAVYGAALADHPDETTAPRDPGPYGQAKLEAEAALRRAAGPVPVTALRLGNVVGADMLGSRVAAGLSITLDRFASGRGPLRSYTSASRIARLAEALRLRQAQGGDLPDCLNVAAPVPVAMEDLLQGAGIPFDWQAAPAGALARATVDCGRLGTILPADPVAESAAGLAAEWLRGLQA